MTPSARLKAQIHIAKKDLQIDDDTYRALLSNTTGKSSCSDMDITDLHKALQAFKDRGWKPRKKTGPKSGKQKTQGDKIRALWISMAKDGLLRDGSEAALRKWIRRETKGKFDAPQFCDAATASRLIEGLKKWRDRMELAKCN